jgi:hypothetical protein
MTLHIMGLVAQIGRQRAGSLCTGHAPCAAARAALEERIGALVQRAYGVFNGHTRILGDYAETGDCCIHLSHRIEPDGRERQLGYRKSR